MNLRHLAALLALPFCGCATSGGKLQSFLDTIPATDIGEIRQTFNCPLWSNTEVATNIRTDDNGLLNVGSAAVTITSSVFSTSASVTGFKQIPTAKQRAAANKLPVEPKPSP